MSAERILVVTSRAPSTFSHDGTRLRVDRGAGGVVTALGDLSRSLPVTWIAASSGPVDREVVAAQRGRGGLVGGGRLGLRLLALADDLHADFHGTFSNRILWFAQHGLWGRRIDPEHPDRVRWLAHRYVAAARMFADAVAVEAHRPDHDPMVMTHDYQLYALPALVRQRVAGLPIAHFIHIPWPDLESWRVAVPDDVCAMLLRGALGADVVGFQDAASRRNFAECVATLIPGASVTEERAVRDGRATSLLVRPASVDPDGLVVDEKYATALRADRRALIVRVDRVDPIKNVPCGFDAFARLLERRPDLIGKVRFIARLTPTRTSLPEYRREWEDAMRKAAFLNARHGAGTVEVIDRPDRRRALAELAAADAILVNSVADGMNLVAKEASFLNPAAALVLSRMAGAYAELRCGALGIDPLSVEETSSAMERALDMTLPERLSRASSLRAAVARWTSRDWARTLISDLLDVRSAAREQHRATGRVRAVTAVRTSPATRAKQTLTHAMS